MIPTYRGQKNHKVIITVGKPYLGLDSEPPED
jgi:hypothetical protein